MDTRRELRLAPSLLRSSPDASAGGGSKSKKGKGKGKDDNKSNNGDGGKGKDRDNKWNSGQQAAQFQGWCSHSARWGHNCAVQYTMISAESCSSCAGVQEPEQEGEGVKIGALERC